MCTNDAGSGAGFPGIPLKLLRPAWKLTLADSRLRRVRFLQAAIQALNLAECEAVHCRLERSGPELRGRFRLIVARALAQPPAVLRSLFRLLSPGGNLVIYTGQLDSSELALLTNEAAKRGLSPPLQTAVELPGKAGHSLIALTRER